MARKEFVVFGLGKFGLSVAKALADNGFVEGENLEILEQNGQNEQSNLQSIAQNFINEEVDLICAVSTSTAQVMAAATSDIPIVGTAITNYEEAPQMIADKVIAEAKK